jgi:hypothetical protein
MANHLALIRSLLIESVVFPSESERILLKKFAL